MLNETFQLTERGTTPLREILAGLTTFLTMAYILVLQPAVLSTDFAGQPTGLDPDAVLVATCVASAIACGLMGIVARLPIALAPGMGQNFFFVTVVMALAASGVGEPWKAALAIVLVAGVLFLVLTLVGVRQVVLDVMSPSMRSAIAVGIGLFIAFIGLKNGGVLMDAPSLVALDGASLKSADAVVFWSGFFVTLLLATRGTPGGILVGIVVSAGLAIALGKVSISQIYGLPTIESPAAFQFDFGPVFTGSGFAFVAAFLFMDIFDTTGTLIGVSQQAGLLRDGELPRMRQAMYADSFGTIAGACLGTSTVTSYIESAAGVQQGGRSGLTAVTVGILFLMAMAFSPLIIALGGYAPITAPALVIVGAMMFCNVREIDWSDETEAIPAFLVVAGIPLFFSIADGIAFGLIAWPILKVCQGRLAEVKWQAYVLTAVLIGYFLFVRS